MKAQEAIVLDSDGNPVFIPQNFKRSHGGEHGSFARISVIHGKWPLVLGFVGLAAFLTVGLTLAALILLPLMIFGIIKVFFHALRNKFNQLN